MYEFNLKTHRIKVVAAPELKLCFNMTLVLPQSIKKSPINVKFYFVMEHKFYVKNIYNLHFKCIIKLTYNEDSIFFFL